MEVHGQLLECIRTETKDGWQEIKQILVEKPERLVGVGEIGLDYFYNHSPKDVQIKALEEQFAVGSGLQLASPSFHVREAYDDFWPVFDNFTGVRSAPFFYRHHSDA